MKKCPYCAEDIQDEAIKCRYCHEFLVRRLPLPNQNSAKLPNKVDQGPWYFRPAVIVIALLSVGPLALPMVWWNPQIKRSWKFGITIATCVGTWVCIDLTIRLLKFLAQQLEEAKPVFDIMNHL